MLKEQIQKDFLLAMKSGDTNAKLAISSLKSKITEAEKANKNIPLSDNEIFKVVNSAINQRKASISEYEKYNRLDLASKEQAELEVISKYLPSQMSEQEIENVLQEILNKEDIKILLSKNKRAAIGKTIGEFNKNYVGRAELSVVNNVINKMVETYA
jgi:uncharacterized protein YqeY